MIPRVGSAAKHLRAVLAQVDRLHRISDSRLGDPRSSGLGSAVLASRPSVLGRSPRQAREHRPDATELGLVRRGVRDGHDVERRTCLRGGPQRNPVVVAARALVVPCPSLGDVEHDRADRSLSLIPNPRRSTRKFSGEQPVAHLHCQAVHLETLMIELVIHRPPLSGEVRRSGGNERTAVRGPSREHRQTAIRGSRVARSRFRDPLEHRVLSLISIRRLCPRRAPISPSGGWRWANPTRCWRP